MLDFEHAKQLLELLVYFLKNNNQVELVLKCAVFILKYEDNFLYLYKNYFYIVYTE